MERRMLGKSGIGVGIVGLGCEGLLGKSQTDIIEALDLLESAGGNALDLYSPDPVFRSRLGQALMGRRNKFVLEAHIGSAWINGQYKRVRDLSEASAAFEDQLVRLNTTYADIGMIHYVDSMEDWNSVRQDGLLDYALGLKKSGVIHATGMSGHNPKVALAAVESGQIDVLLFAINPCYDLQPAREDVEQLWNRDNYKTVLENMDHDRQTLYEACARLGVGITVMKAFGGGDLLKADMSLAGVALTVDQCLAYALDRPGVGCVFAGAHSMAELKTSLGFTGSTPQERDYATALASFPRVSWKGHCMYCGHCAPCPVGINVATITKYLNLALARNTMPETVREHYGALRHKAGECLKCGECAARCPFEVDAPANMSRAAEIFGM